MDILVITPSTIAYIFYIREKHFKVHVYYLLVNKKSKQHTCKHLIDIFKYTQK